MDDTNPMLAKNRFMDCVRADAIVRDIREGHSLAGQVIEYANDLVHGGMVDIEQVAVDRLRAGEDHSAAELSLEFLDWQYSTVNGKGERITGGPKPEWVEDSE